VTLTEAARKVVLLGAKRRMIGSELLFDIYQTGS
jgi:hypothetical protein